MRSLGFSDMLRGLDVPGVTGTGDDDVPTMIKVAGRTELDADVTVYLRDRVESAERERQEVVLEEMDRLQDAGVLDSVVVESWSEVPAGDRYREFVDAVGADALDPFFAPKAEDGGAVEVPAVCIAIREDGDLSGLYPIATERTDQTVGDCVRALCAGDRVRNVPN